MELKDCVKGHVQFCKLDHTEGKEPTLWYECANGFKFPIPLSETQGAIFGSVEKGLTFMRWIRPHLELIKSSKEQQ